MLAAPFWAIKRYVQVSLGESLSKTQSEGAERNLLSTVTIFHRLDAVNVIDLCREQSSLRTELIGQLTAV